MSYQDPPVFGTEEKDSLVYSRLLFQCGLGYPLWKPRPQLFSLNTASNVEEEGSGVQIGDLGVLTKDGAFVSFLNVGLFERSLGRRTLTGIFEGIEIETLDPHPLVHGTVFPGIVFAPTERSPPPQFDRSNSPETRVQVHFRGSGGKSAVLGIFPETPTLVQRCSDTEIPKLRDYISQNHSRWFRFVRHIPQYHNVKSLFLVTGFTKSKSWGKTLMKKSRDITQCSVTFTKRDDQGDSIQIHTSPTSPSNSFMRRRSNGNSTHANQALFINGLLITARSTFSLGLGGDDILETLKDIDTIKKLFQNGGPFLVGNSSNTFQGNGVLDAHVGGGYPGSRSASTSSTKCFNPLTAVNEFILRIRPDIEVSITYDDDLNYLITDSKLANFLAECTEEEFVSVVSSNYIVSTRNGCGFLERVSEAPEVNPLSPPRSKSLQRRVINATSAP